MLNSYKLLQTNVAIVHQLKGDFTPEKYFELLIQLHQVEIPDQERIAIENTLEILSNQGYLEIRRLRNDDEGSRYGIEDPSCEVLNASPYVTRLVQALYNIGTPGQVGTFIDDNTFENYNTARLEIYNGANHGLFPDMSAAAVFSFLNTVTEQTLHMGNGITIVQNVIMRDDVERIFIAPSLQIKALVANNFVDPSRRFFEGFTGHSGEDLFSDFQ